MQGRAGVGESKARCTQILYSVARDFYTGNFYEIYFMGHFLKPHCFQSIAKFIEFLNRIKKEGLVVFVSHCLKYLTTPRTI